MLYHLYMWVLFSFEIWQFHLLGPVSGQAFLFNGTKKLCFPLLCLNSDNGYLFQLGLNFMTSTYCHRFNDVINYNFAGFYEWKNHIQEYHGHSFARSEFHHYTAFNQNLWPTFREGCAAVLGNFNTGFGEGFDCFWLLAPSVPGTVSMSWHCTVPPYIAARFI